MKNSEFYNVLSKEYDSMIKFESSLKNKLASLNYFLEPNYRTALDLGCGTGIDSIALSQFGLNVDAIDHSEEMIKKAIQNAKYYNAKINFIHSDLINISLNKKFDIIISLGNTLVNLPLKETKILIVKLKNLLSKNGKILIQTINYSALPSAGEYILNTFENEKLKIIRSYKIHKSHIDFAIDLFNKNTETNEHIVTKIFPLSTDNFKMLAENYDLEIDVFGSLMKDSYIEKKSKNIVVQFKGK